MDLISSSTQPSPAAAAAAAADVAVVAQNGVILGKAKEAAAAAHLLA